MSVAEKSRSRVSVVALHLLLLGCTVRGEIAIPGD